MSEIKESALINKLKALNGVYLNKEYEMILSANIDDIKYDSDKGIILNILKNAKSIHINLNKELKDGEAADSLYILYINSKEILVKYRFSKITTACELSNKFDLDIKTNELAYFVLIMCYFSMKLHDTFPMIPALYKTLLNCTNLSQWRDETDILFENDELEWDEKFDKMKKTTELDITKASLKLSTLRVDKDAKDKYKEEREEIMKTVLPEGLIMSFTVSNPLYISKEFANMITAEKGLIYSKYYPIGYKLMII